ncbi:MAG: TrmH family RNA methyltransferase, partial [Acidobacteriota bacterium]
MIHVVLVAPEIPSNTGNIGRSCLAFGAKLHLVRPFGFSLAERRLKRAGLDYWQHVDVETWDSWDVFDRHLATLGTPFFFTAEATTTLDRVDFPTDSVLLFGSETRGLPDALRQRPTQVSIPMID